MSEKTVRRIHLIYGVVLSVLILCVGGCFAVSCVQIYESGDSPFTRESVGAALDRIALPVWVCLALILGGGVLTLVLPLTARRGKASARPDVMLIRLASSYDWATAPEEIRVARVRAELRRRMLTVAEAVTCVVAAIPALVWVLDAEHFAGADKTADIRRAATVVLVSVAVAMVICVVLEYLRRRSFERETAAVKAAIAERKVEKLSADKRNIAVKAPAGHLITWGVRGVILAVAVVFIILGVTNGGMADVLGKAIRICTECIGLG